MQHEHLKIHRPVMAMAKCNAQILLIWLVVVEFVFFFRLLCTNVAALTQLNKISNRFLNFGFVIWLWVHFEH